MEAELHVNLTQPVQLGNEYKGRVTCESDSACGNEYEGRVTCDSDSACAAGQ